MEAAWIISSTTMATIDMSSPTRLKKTQGSDLHGWGVTDAAESAVEVNVEEPA